MNAPPQISETPLAGGVTQETQEDTDGAIVAQVRPDAKAFCSAQAALCLRGHELTQSVRAEDGRRTWVVSRWGQSRTLGHWNDVLAFLAQVGGAP